MRVSPDLGDLRGASRRTLERLFCAGTAPDPDDLVGWEFRGTIPATLARTLRLNRFVKGFFRDDDTPPGEAVGYNSFCGQRSWRRVGPRHGYFRVRPAVGRHEGSLLFDYADTPRNAAWNPERLFRDFVVHPDPENRDLVLGKAYLKVGPLVPASFFILDRDRKIA